MVPGEGLEPPRPLGHPALNGARVCQFRHPGKWWAREDLNLRLTGYEPGALAAELRAHFEEFGAAGRI